MVFAEFAVALRVLPVTVLTGARQTGKTTLTKSIKPSRAYFTLDDMGVLDQAERNPDSLLATRPVILDEVQRAPQLLLGGQTRRGRTPSRRRFHSDRLGQSASDGKSGGHFGRTRHLFGTAAILSRRVAAAQGCPGAAGSIVFSGLRLAAMARRTGRLANLAASRGFPPALQIDSEADRGLWFGAYVQTYLERDLRQLSAVSSLPDFQRVMALAAQRTGKLLNQADLARDAALSHPTTHRYLNLLETGCLITRIRPLATNPSATLVKAPKLLWADCGLAASLAGIKSSTGLARRMDAGFWLEQTLFQTLQTWRALEPHRRRLHFWRDRAGTKWISSWSRTTNWSLWRSKPAAKLTASDTVGIRALRDSLKQKASLVRGVVLHAGKARPLDVNDVALPWGWMVPASG
jgi:hypothetical protein